MLDDRRRPLIVEAHHLVRGTKDRFIANLCGERGVFDGWCMPDCPLTDEDMRALKHLDLAQVAALDKIVEGALGAVLFEYSRIRSRVPARSRGGSELVPKSTGNLI